MSLPALTRYQRTQARINEILDEIRDNPMATEAEIVRTLAKRWGLNRYTVEKNHAILQARRHDYSKADFGREWKKVI